MPLPVLSSEEQRRNLELEGCRSVFVDDRTAFIVLKDGTVYPVEIVVDGKTVSSLSMGAALAQTTIPSVMKRVDEGHVFVGSTVGPSVLLKTARVEEEVSGDNERGMALAAVVEVDNNMELDDDDGQSNSLPAFVHVI
jgi:cleavage and polyadenylation specificity factor subunit 1